MFYSYPFFLFQSLQKDVKNYVIKSGNYEEFTPLMGKFETKVAGNYMLSHDLNM